MGKALEGFSEDDPLADSSSENFNLRVDRRLSSSSDSSELCESAASALADLRVEILVGRSATDDLFLVFTIFAGFQLGERNIPERGKQLGLTSYRELGGPKHDDRFHSLQR